MFNFVADRLIKDKAYPALSSWTALPYTQDWQKFVGAWPYTIPCELHEHCAEFGVPFKLWTIDENYPKNSYYTIGLGFFDFTIDYFGLMSDQVHAAIKNQRLQVLFYYHEGDNPYHIKNRLDSLCSMYGLSIDCYRFISGNTAADTIPGFVYFPDHELLYWRRNRIPPIPVHVRPRERDFTALSRTHKWWRATVMADLHRNNLLANSYWSYNTLVSIDDRLNDNPIEIDTLAIQEYLTEFLTGGPYCADILNDNQHNDHSIVETTHFTNSYCNIVLETHFDADQSSGAFLTEKTFKVIKHGQPFIIVGPAGSLATLRHLGYCTFDHAIDNSYDLETNNTQRWIKIIDAIKKIKQQNMHEWFKQCLNDVTHNQQLFVRTKTNRLNNLLTKLQTL